MANQTETIIVDTGLCVFCGEGGRVEVPRAGYDQWRAGDYIQVALRTVSEDEREQLLSGIHGSCFDAAYPDESEGSQETDVHK